MSQTDVLAALMGGSFRPARVPLEEDDLCDSDTAPPARPVVSTTGGKMGQGTIGQGEEELIRALRHWRGDSNRNP
ncbi:MAG: hypothetical protein FD149_1601 [Rhodospirillaceae bacterium]|nr:MAG: hypothetical protein FD149_1601 [Rhodospirillaceae bacterium]